MKKYISIILCLILCISLASCGGKTDETETAKELTESYMQLVKNFDLEGISDVTANRDFRYVNEKLAILPDQVMEMVKSWAGNMEYEIGDVSLEELTGVANIKIKYTDATEVMRAASLVYMAKTSNMMGSDGFEGWLSGPGGGPKKTDSEKLSSEIDAFLYQCIADAVESEGLGTMEKTIPVELVKYQGEWKIKNLSMDIFNVLTSNAFILSQEEQ
ncbi:MAG: hypothetical protein IJJ48_02000 [Firmicutes bacterium]|nr:hypothetical protein [Bacillota bacterium]